MASVSVQPKSHQLGSSHPLLKIDWILLITTLLIAFGGVLAIQSAEHGYTDGSSYPHKQLVGIVIGTAVMVGLGISSYASFVKRSWIWIYTLNLLLLGLVLLHGHSSHGAQRWIGIGPVEIQPSEFAKLVIIVSLANFLNDRREHIGEIKILLQSLLLIGIPMALIFKQPDLGTALVILTIWLGMTLIAGAKLKHLALIVGAGILLFTAAWHTPFIKSYQKQRIAVFLNPDKDRKVTGYHLRQSEIAVGSGGITGQGYEKGLQANGHFIPEQHTDFIFTIIGEEGGLTACCILLGLYLILLQRCVAILITADDMLGRLLIAGVVSMLTFHIVVNVGMTIGVMPVTGVPLPFVSYGLSALIIGMASLGLVMSVGASRGETMFGKD
jgi:rod shape determining protein RodA